MDNAISCHLGIDLLAALSIKFQDLVTCRSGGKSLAGALVGEEEHEYTIVYNYNKALLLSCLGE